MRPDGSVRTASRALSTPGTNASRDVVSCRIVSVSPAPPKMTGMSGIDPLETINYKEADLERLFSRVQTQSIEKLVNRGEVVIDTTNGLIRNDTVWKGFFPSGHTLNQLSTAFFASFKKRFSKTADGKFTGLTSDSDGRIKARNTLE